MHTPFGNIPRFNIGRASEMSLSVGDLATNSGLRAAEPSGDPAKRTLRSWLRALSDCGVMRVSFGDAVLIEAFELGLVDYTRISGKEETLDFRLTAAGARTLVAQVRST